jgi:hypothetical protein
MQHTSAEDTAQDGTAPDGTASGSDEVEEPEPRKVPVPGACPECGAAELRAYPVLASDGWWQAVTCQRCLATASREPWHRLGWVRLPEDRW